MTQDSNSNTGADQGSRGASRTEGVNVGVAETTGAFDETLSQEEIERGRLDQGWRQFVNAEQPSRAQVKSSESWEDIAPEKVNTAPMQVPLSGDVAGPSVLRVQLLLDRSRISPGVMDGRWGKNTEQAVFWAQKRTGLPANGQVDEPTYRRLIELAGNPDKLVVEHRLTQEDVEGPFVEIPEDIYAKAELDCMCYTSLPEKLAERFHVTEELLGQLNPNVDLAGLKAGDTIMVPNLRPDGEVPQSEIAELVVSDGGHYVNAVDGNGNLVYHFPSTLGSTYNPSPEGDYRITAIAPDPTWHYQPELLGEDKPRDAMIPPGPNSPVGKVWMALSKPHYGIHGTSRPETIGYATSHGCIRLTNWDAVFLSNRIQEGIPVRFVDTGNPLQGPQQPKEGGDA